ncbi:tyrosine-type recombinase/integrase [Bifidobacterium sp. 82T25]|nr:tyrosine-type recombinase/integrase [Bifidobacterium miconisargentati]
MSMKSQPIPEVWREAVNGFLEYEKAQGMADSTLNTRRIQLCRFARITGTPPEQVTAAQIVEVLAAAKAQETRRNLRSALVTFFSWCYREGIRGDDLAAAIPKMKMPRPHPRPCPEEYITEALGKATEPERLMLALAAEYGLRRGEIARVHSNDVIPSENGWALMVNGKGDKQRILPIRDDLAQRLRAADGYVFPGRNGGHVADGYVGKHISRLLPEGWSAHKLRHRFATVAYAQSHDMLGVARALGHASTKTTEHYVALPEYALCSLVNAAAMQGDKVRMEPPSRQDSPAPPRRSNGDIRYPYEGKNGRETAQTTPEAVRMALMLTLYLAEHRAGGAREFDISAEWFAELHRVRAIGYARRSSVVRAAARRLSKAGMVDLVPNHLGQIRGTINFDVATLCGLAGMLAAEYTSKMTR